MKPEKLVQLAPKLLTIIVDRDNISKLEDILGEKRVRFHFMFNAMGTASSEILQSLGLSGTEKTVCICIEPGVMVHQLMSSVADRLSLTRPGNGITFIVPISGVSAAISTTFNEELEHINERLENLMDTVMEDMKEEVGFSLVLSVINQGFSEILMDAARSVGARGGTIIHARRSGLDDAVKFFGVTLQAEKEIVAIVVPRNQKKELMQAITKKCGVKTEAHGVVFSLPVESCSGISVGQQHGV